MFAVNSSNKLFKIHRQHLDSVDFTDRERNILMFQRDTKQRTCAREMKSGTVFTKIFQSGDCAWSLLNFVKNQNGFAVSDFAVSKQRNFVYNTFCVIIVIKNGCKLAVSLKVYIADVFKIFFTELSEGMSFTALTHTGKNQRFSSAAVFPFN
ncbi:MAG: hypothetical protein IIT56_08800 [Bacteroidales bacterium]|nr:hypothetical protein [Bacteroidales bacterium]